jgi:peptide chain release factor 3
VPILGAVGALQFDVVQYRLQAEYNLETRLETAPWAVLRWVCPDAGMEQLRELILPGGVKLAQDASGDAVLLFPSEWALRYFASNHPQLGLQDAPFRRGLGDDPSPALSKPN